MYRWLPDYDYTLKVLTHVRLPQERKVPFFTLQVKRRKACCEFSFDPPSNNRSTATLLCHKKKKTFYWYFPFLFFNYFVIVKKKLVEDCTSPSPSTFPHCTYVSSLVLIKSEVIFPLR